MRKIIIVCSIILFALLFIRFVLGGPEDDWICVDGNWVKHGHPSSPMPQEECKNE